ncbi:rhamnogalacturonan acetylesterase [Actinoalloteichus caeruleus]|uniref:rhamnogalacturonan acetylesterase n=1 Tax=Actinoalloteichus cyanogriseus TaxID=2893586 RepID=UPI00068A3D86|nr:rhamnogalacturonan acetylesterase [Actinoalloteichus caeruleus]
MTGQPRSLVVVGDSTAATYAADEAPQAGWGQALPAFLRPHLTVRNTAWPGASTRSFLDSGRGAAALDLLRPSDLLLVSFGHNDHKAFDPARYAPADTDYRHNLRLLVDGAQRRGARPVLVTSVERRVFDERGRAGTSHGPYPAAMMEVAAATGASAVDLARISRARWDRLGPERTAREVFLWLAPGESPNHPEGVRDDTHFTGAGAVVVARMLVSALRRLGVLSEEDVRGLDREVEAGEVGWPEVRPAAALGAG